jgi:hypothetical protein
LDPKVAAELRLVAGSRGVSSFVNDAVRQRLQARRLQRLLDDMDDEFGPISDEVAREVDTVTWPMVDGSADPR